MRQVWDTIAQFHMLDDGDRVLLGVSGGPDSVALLHMLYSRAEQYGIGLYVVHVHHMLRPEADEEARYVATLAEQYGLPFRLYKVDVAAYAKLHKMSLEQAGHMVRFQCFQDAKALWGINKLALGHHRDDRAESVLMHMVQGCGLDGLAAMPPVDIWDAADHSQLIRPLAQVPKEALIAYCTEHGLRYYIDATNLEPDCLRNQMRLELLPLLYKYNPQMADTLVRMQDSISADLDYIETQVEHLWRQYGKTNEEKALFPADVFRMQHIAVQRRLLRMLYRQWTGANTNLTFAQVEQMRNIARVSEGTKQIMLADGVVFVRQYDLLYITAHEEKKTANVALIPYQWEIEIQPKLETRYGKFTIQYPVEDAETEDKGSEYCSILADADQLENVLFVRSRQAGDQVQLMGKNGHKSVKKLFIDEKIPQPERGNVPIVLSGEQIVWIPGHYKANHIGVTAQTKRICKLSFSKR